MFYYFLRFSGKNRFASSIDNIKNRGWALQLKPVILATQKAEIRRILAQDQPRQNSSRDPISINKKLRGMACACHPSYTGIINRRIAVWVRTYLKNNQI
jgi:hypothetical protein